MRSERSDPPSRQPFVVGEWLIEPALSQATKGDRLVRLRPQLVDLLSHLADRAGETVSKEELLDAVWSDRFIADGGVAKCIAELRQLFGDDSRQPAFIQTIPKRGYRLVAPVSKPAAATGTAPGAQDLLQPLAPSPSSDAEPASPAPRRRTLMLSATVLLTLAAIGLAWFLAVRSSSPAAPMDPDVMVLAFDRFPPAEDVAEAARVALAVEFERLESVRILSDVHTAQLLASMGRRSDEPVTRAVAREICQRAGATGVVAASVTPLGGRLLVSVEVEACGSADAVGTAQDEAAAVEQLPQVLGRLASSVRPRVASALGSIRARRPSPLALASTSSLDALRAFSLADEARMRGNMAEAIRLYERAVSLDPLFASAFARLGSLQTTAVSSIYPTGRAEGLVGDDVKRASYLRKAYELRDRVSEPERFHITALHQAWIERHPEKALATLRSWLALHPGAVTALAESSRLNSAWLGHYDDAIAQAREALRLSPGDVITLISLVDACLGANRYAEAATHLADAAKRAPDNFGVRGWLYGTAVLSGDREAIERQMHWASADPAIHVEFKRFEAQRAMAGGRLRDASEMWREVYEWNAARGYRTSMAGIRATEALWRAWIGETAGVREAAREAAASEHPTVLMEAGVALALVGEVAQAAAIAGRMQRHAIEGDMTMQVFVPVIESAIALRQGAPQRALERLRLSEPYELGRVFRFLPLALRVRAALGASRWSEAADASSLLITHRGAQPTSLFLSTAHLDLARARARAGDPVRAAAAYRQFLSLWKGADANVPLATAAARELIEIERP